ncbi:immunoglobulin kappa light chain-like isoform X2 [Labrus mixtus]|uniref:immunoglobulin kappa light chain-like isoform X2 n=1 Tax=Labrus mixtus TaxID=508554 RepID=UPI0029BFEB05|nr:immunoglobulin kappa light chain-like isoform X2 [Labrus mixtus]
MLLLPAAALCCLCSALVSMAAELIQDDLSLTRRVGEEVSFSCGGTDQCGSYVYWYQKKDTETFRVILRIDRSTGALDKRYNHPQEDDFSAVKKKGWELQIQRVKDSHSATYYCSFCFTVWGIFGSGTKLFVTDEQVVKPVVSVYPAASRAQLEEKNSLLCVASAMFPPLVQISWKKQKVNGPLQDAHPAKAKQQELRESGCSASILTIPQREYSTYKYLCSVQHQGGTVNAQTGTEVPVPTTSSPPEREPTDLPTLQPTDNPASSSAAQAPTAKPALQDAGEGVSFQSQCKVKLLTLLYTVLILKSLVYCCGLSLLRIFRNNKPSIH